MSGHVIDGVGLAIPATPPRPFSRSIERGLLFLPDSKSGRKSVAKRTPDVFEGEAIDTGLVVPRLTEYERQRVHEAKAASTEALGRAAAEIRRSSAR
jgi:hypothetical protein